MIVIDFETRSRVDLLKCGASVYARGESTEVLCLGILTGNGAIVWKAGNPDPTFLLKAIENGELIHAHNVGFERAIWTHICHKRMGCAGDSSHQCGGAVSPTCSREGDSRSRQS